MSSGLRKIVSAFAVSLLGVACLLGLAGCGAKKNPTAAPLTEASGCDLIAPQDVYLNGHVETCTVTMPDTRRVTCIVYVGHKQGGLSCDWDHADGADKGWDQ